MIELHFKDLDLRHLLPGLLFLGLISVRFVLQKAGWWKRSHLAHSLLHSFSDQLAPASPWQRSLPGFLQGLSLLFLYLAFLNPVLPLSEHKLMSEGLGIILVLDLSTSMLEFMESPEASGQKGVASHGDPGKTGQTRLDAVKAAALDFIRRRPQDRMGLVVFSMNAYVVSPMTTDHGHLFQYVHTVDSDALIGEGMTSIGAGISAAIHLMKMQTQGKPAAGRSNEWMLEKKGQGKVIVVFTDADQNYGLDPFIPLQQAKDLGYRVYFIGLASSQDPAMKDFWGELNLAIQSTGGRYFDVQDKEQLRQAYLHIDSLEKTLFSAEQQIKNVPVYSFFAQIAFAWLALSIGLRAFRYFTRLA